MKILCCITALIVITVALLSHTNAPEKIITPHSKSKKTLTLSANATLFNAKQFLTNLSNYNQKNRITQFNSLKSSFKQSEFLVQFIDPAFHSKFLNGAPLPKIQHGVPDLTVIEPTGFQYLEELIYTDAPITEIENSLKILIQNLNTSQQLINKVELTDSELFEAMRYGIVTLNAMGITGFDSPENSSKALKESFHFLDGIHTHFKNYQSYIAPKKFEHYSTLFSDAKKQLINGDFDSFDRLKFLKEFLNPLYEGLYRIQKELFIETPAQRDGLERPINYDATNLMASDFLNENYFFHTIFNGNKTAQQELGKLLFFDPVLSLNNDRACASCHHPDKAFAENLPKSIATATFEPLQRNAPTLTNVIYAEKFFHDFRATELYQQIDHVVMSEEEFNFNYPDLIEKLQLSDDYKALFDKAYGSKEINADKLKFALISFLKSLESNQSVFDKYVRNEIQSINQNVIKGYNLFTGKAACATCHFSPTFSGLVPPFYVENETEILGVPSSIKNKQLDKDLGRARNGDIRENVPFYQHSFKTPTLRNIALTAPYMHNGVYQTLEEVLDFYNNGGGKGLGYEVPHQTLPEDKLNLTPEEQTEIIAFMNALTDTTNFNQTPKKLPSFGIEKLDNRKIGGEY